MTYFLLLDASNKYLRYQIKMEKIEIFGTELKSKGNVFLKKFSSLLSSFGVALSNFFSKMLILASEAKSVASKLYFFHNLAYFAVV